MSGEKMQEGGQQDQAQRQQEEMILSQRMSEIGRKLLVLSGKGGVGKSTVATNLAVALAEAGRKVGLLDVDIHGPSVPKMLGLEGGRLVSDGMSFYPVQAGENLLVMSIAFLLQESSDAVIWRGPRKFSAIRQFLTDVAWGKLDFLIVDSPPGTGDEPLSVAQLVGSPAEAVIVTTPQDVAISDVRRCVSFCRAMMLPVAGIVENMSGFVCPRCGERVDLFKTGGGRELAEKEGVPFLGSIPFEPTVVESGDAGEPFISSASASAVSQTFSGIVDALLSTDK